MNPIRNFLDEFRQFINRGNLLVITIGFVMGSAFSGLVTALVENIVMPIVAIPFGKPDFDDVFVLRVNDAEVRFGAFLTVAVAFVLVAFVLFVLLKVYNRAVAREVAGDGPATPTEIGLLMEIRDELRARRTDDGTV